MKSKEEVVQEFRVASIQEAAMRVIARKGMAAATMQEIAREAGVAKGTIYLYFRDRDELVERTFETAIGELHHRIDGVLDLELPFDEKLREIVGAQLAFFREHAEFFRLYISLRMSDCDPPHQRRQKHAHPEYRRRVERFTAFLSAAMDRGEIRRVDPHRLAIFLMEGITAIVLERLSETAGPSEEADVEFLSTVALLGISLSNQKRSSD